jgi:polyisoprenyl-phosphate glycosyltransferase
LSPKKFFPSYTLGKESSIHVTILIPVFNDWPAAQQLISQIDRVLAGEQISADVLFVDDGSAHPAPEPFLDGAATSLTTIHVLGLKRNLGHQRALCVGLVHLYLKQTQGPVLIMDADGEDAPSDIPLLLKEYANHGSGKVVFASRGRRAEGFIFKFFYQLYRAAHRVLVGFDIRVGNFSLIPGQFLERLAVTSDLWNHYAAAVVKIRLPRALVPIDRSKRISGKSKMGFVSLIVHGLSAMSVFGELVGVRLLIASAIFGALMLVLVLITFIIKFATNLAIPGWATFVTGLLLVALLQSVLLSLIFTFVVLYSRTQTSHIPIRDCPLYVREERTLFTKNA